jgi:hypothetical protein
VALDPEEIKDEKQSRDHHQQSRWPKLERRSAVECDSTFAIAIVRKRVK